MMNVYKQRINRIEELEELQGKPGRLASNKVINYLDSHIQQFLARSPLVIVSTADASGNCDSSPRGDHPGFTHILDEKHLIIPERPGNRRMDSLRNILENPHIGLLFFIPGLEETLRINGEAVIVKDPELMDKLKSNGHIPPVAIVVKAEECYVHCAKALIRSKVWSPEYWPDKNSLDPPAKMLAAHSKLSDVDEKEVQQALNISYTKRLY